MRTAKLLSLFFAGCFLFCFPAKAIDLIPYPSYVKTEPGQFKISAGVPVRYQGNLKEEALFLMGMLQTEFQIKAAFQKGGGAAIVLVEDKSLLEDLGAEGYRLAADNDKISVMAATAQGVFYGVQSLRQLIVKNGASGYAVQGVRIEDKPRFAWRAFMLDEGRYFKGMETVKQLLDQMARLKLNTFHWHLTDDQGWRIEIKKYPLLTDIGSKRDSTQLGVWPTGWESSRYDGKPHAGFYTQQQIKEIIAYAAERHITIIPEIEMPGHASAAIAAYPWLGTPKVPIRVPVKFGVQYDVFNVTDPRVEGFLRDVLDEVIQLFPSPVIHIGGDEVRYDQWKASAEVNDFMKQNGIGSYAALQIWFTNRMSGYIESKGRRMMGWNEIMGASLHDFTSKEDTTVLQVPLAKSTIVHFWKGETELINDAVSKGYDIVNSYHEFTYLDYNHEKIPLSKAYSFNPVPENLSGEYHDKIMGLGCQMWGEWIPTSASMQQLVFPRMAAYAEVGWTDDNNKNYERFLRGLPHFYRHWQQAGIDFTKGQQ